MRTFLCEGARFLQQQGWTLFPWSRSLFLIGIPFWAYFAGSFPYRSCSQVYPKRREQVIHLFIQTWLSRNPCLVPSAYLMPSPYMPLASGSPSISILSVSEYLQFYYFVVPGSSSHPTASHDKSRLTAHYLPSLYSLLILSLSVAPYSIFPSVTFYADGLWSEFPLVVYVYF